MKLQSFVLTIVLINLLAINLWSLSGRASTSADGFQLEIFAIRYKRRREAGF